MSQRHPASLIRHYADSTDPDQRTSMADARIAFCVARGVDMDDIDPASGYNYSRDAYDRCRDSWVWNIKPKVHRAATGMEPRRTWSVIGGKVREVNGYLPGDERILDTAPGQYRPRDRHAAAAFAAIACPLTLAA